MASKAPKTEKMVQEQEHLQQENAATKKNEPALISVVQQVKPLLGLSRLNEKNTLINLNNRFAAIIERNQKLEKDNSNLTQKIVAVEEEKKTTLKRVELTFKKDCDDYRKKLGDAEKENKKLALEDAKLKSEIHDTKDKLNKKEHEAKELADKLKKLEKENEKLAADVKKSEEEKKKLEKEKKNAEDLNNKKDKEIAALRAELEKESLAKIDLENQLRNRENEFTVKSELLQQEVREFKAKYEIEAKELDGKLQNDYEIKLQQMLDELRAEYEKQLATCKAVQKDLLHKKEEDFKAMLEHLKLDLQTKTKAVKDLGKKFDDAQEKLAKLEGEKTGLNKTNEELKKKMKDERIRLDKEKKMKDKENLEILAQKEKLTTEYSELLEIKLTLDNEIATYRTMLEGEEIRLHLNNDENANVQVQEEPLSKHKTAPAAAIPSQ